MSEATLTAWKLLAATAALLAFLVSLYTLVGRERKSPHQINNLFFILSLCMAGAVFDLASTIVPIPWDRGLLYVGVGFLLLASGLTTFRLYRLYFRFALFVDSAHPKHLWIVRYLKDIGRRLQEEKNYEHHAMGIPADLQDTLSVILSEEGGGESLQINEQLGFKSAAIRADTQAHANAILIRMAAAFLEKGYPVQYMTASRHPIEFVRALKASMQSSKMGWNAVSRNVVVVDAYTRHFGFTDSIYFVATRQLKDEFSVTRVSASISYPGLHSASSAAFNKIKEMATQQETRRPALVVYEDCYALSDLESPEQYRVFVRHVLPSERLWDGMFTVFVETNVPDEHWGLLRSYVSISTELSLTKH